MVKQTLTPPIKILIKPTQTIQIIRKTEDLDLSTHPVRPVAKLTISQRIVTSEQTQRTDGFPEQTTGRAKSSPTETGLEQLRWKCYSCSSSFKLETPRLHSGAACDRPETTKSTKLQHNPEVVCQQTPETFKDQYS